MPRRHRSRNRDAAVIDIHSLAAKQRARRTAQMPAEYACSIQGYKRPANNASRVLLVIAAMLLLAAWRM
jgi:hypothetical protein